MSSYEGAARVCAIVGEDDPNLTWNGNDDILLRQMVRELMEEIIDGYGCNEFISGMHRGGEFLGAELAIEIKKERGVKFWGIISSEEQWLSWTTAEKDVFFSRMEQADYEYRVSNRENAGSRSLQLKIIEEEADVFIVFRARDDREINEMLAQAAKKKKKIYIIEPKNAEISPFLELVE